jgi:hypothetical protein
VLARLNRKVEAPEWDGWTPGSLPGQGERGTGGSVLRFYLPRSTRWCAIDDMDCSRDYYFRWVAPPLQSGVVGALSGMGYMVPQPFATGGN